MKKKTSFIKQIQVWGVIVLLAVGSSIIALDVVSSYLEFRSRTEIIRREYISRQKDLVKYEVRRVIRMIRHKKSQSDTLTRERIRSRVNEAYTVAQYIYRQNNGNKNVIEIKKMILDALRPVRYEQGRGYFFVATLAGDVVLSPAFPELEGRNLVDLRDSKGNYTVREELDVLKGQGEGFVVGYWPKPDGKFDKSYKKITFVKKLGLFDWSLGSGLYVDDTQKQITSELLSDFSTLRFGENGGILVCQYDGSALVADGSYLVGTKKLWELPNHSRDKVKIIFDQMSEAGTMTNGNYIRYWWKQPGLQSKEIPKIAFVSSVPELKWLVAASVSLDGMDETIADLRAELIRQILAKVFFFSFVVAVIIVFFLVFSRHLRQKFTGDFKLFIEFVDEAAHSNQEIDRSSLQFIEFDQAAETINNILKNLRKSEEYFRTLVEQSPLSIHIFDTNGLTLSVNRAWEELWQVAASEVVGVYNCLEDESLVGTEWHDQFCRAFVGETVDLPEIEYNPTDTGKAGRERIIKCFAFPITNIDAVERVVLIHQDVTIQKKVEEDLKKVERLKSVGMLAGGIAHDFNNILMGIFGNIAMAKLKIAKGHPSIKYLEGAEGSMGRATRLTKQLLTFAKGGAPVKESTCIARLVEEVVYFDLSGSNVKPIFEQPDDLWSTEVDRGQIQQVISNLTINAAQAMPSGGHLYITLKNVIIDDASSLDIKEGRYVSLVVQDEGTGIDSKNLDRVFDPYFSTKQTGSGLGLATVFSIIKKHGGRIVVASELGRGTTFTLYLPATEKPDGSCKDSDTDVAPSTTSPAKILVVDDEEVIRSVATQLLDSIGLFSETAADGEEALVLYRQALNSGVPFNAVIIDLTIPAGMGGEATIKKLLEIDPEVKAIVSSGYADDPVMANYADYGFKGVVEKPYNLGTLREAIYLILGR